MLALATQAHGATNLNPVSPAPSLPVREIEYGQAGGQPLCLDVSVPEGAGPFPVAVLVHGGGWGSGDKRDILSQAVSPLISTNFTWFSINYRLAPTNRWPACFDDVQTALRWVKTNASRYKGDPRRVALFGYSAGGHLACLAAVLAKDDVRPQAVVGFAAPTDLEADCERRGGISPALQALFGLPETLNQPARSRLRELSPLTHVKAGLPPFLLIHGTEDKSVPYAQSVRFQAELKKNGVECDLVTIQGATHKLQSWASLDHDYQARLVSWLNRVFPAPQSNER